MEVENAIIPTSYPVRKAMAPQDNNAKIVSG